MITFKQISWKNFLSTGNSPNTIQLNRSMSTLIVGKNGEGKSTILDALTFALFGKPFRNINKPQLINSINGKNCLVEVEFDIGTNQYKIIRGIKPGVFQIFCNDQLLNQDSANKDYQDILEKQILKLNYKTFTQVVILGSASFVPFMQLPAAQRRSVIEDILDISVFSVMNQILKDKVSTTNEQIRRMDNEIEKSRTAVEQQKKIISTMVTGKKDLIAQIDSSIKANEEEIEKAEAKWDELNKKADQLLESSENQEELDRMISAAIKAKNNFSNSIERNDKTLAFFNKNTTCPSCSQGIPHEHKDSIISTIKQDQDQLSESIKTVDAAYDKLLERQSKQNEINKEITQINMQCNALNTTIKNLNKQNKKYEEDKQKIVDHTADIDAEKAKLKEIAQQAMEHVSKKNELLDEQQIQNVASLLLKDTGVKTAIIKEYLPVMNKLINGYLSAMDFYVHFELDESFNEVIKSRFRDEFTYASFSEGEKMRIDLAILFTWRQIAKMKNSVNTNLLLLDEIFDSSLDVAGTDYFLTIMNSLQDKTNVFVISHKGDQLFDKFHSVIKVEKKNDFSVIA